MKRLWIMLIVFVLSYSAFAEISAVLTSVKGKVEIKTNSTPWAPAVAGIKIPKGATISTGFKGEAIIEIGESILTVRRLTRMTLEELLEKEGTIKTDLYLGFGTVKGDIKSTAGLKNDYKLTSPTATASVRGTIFSFDGVHLNVEEGTVILLNKLNHKRSVSNGESGTVSGYSIPVTPEAKPPAAKPGEEPADDGSLPDIPLEIITIPINQRPSSIGIVPGWPVIENNSGSSGSSEITIAPELPSFSDENTGSPQ